MTVTLGAAWRRRSATSFYTLVNIITRGALAVLGISIAGQPGWSAASTALVVAYGTLAMRFGRVVVSPLLAKVPLRVAVVGNLVAAALGLALLAARGAPLLVFVGVTLLGIGYGGCILSIKVALVADRSVVTTRTLGNLAIALNVGAALGPLISGALFDVAGSLVNFGTLASISAAGAISAAFALPRAENSVPMDSGGNRLTARIRGVPRAAVAVLITLTFAFILYAQLYSVLPLLVTQRMHAPEMLGLMFGLNAVIVICLQRPISDLIVRSALVERLALASGIGLFAVAVLVLAIAESLVSFAIAVLIASVAECLVLPVAEARLSELIGGQRLTVAFTLSALAMGSGETIGAYLGVRATLSHWITGFLLTTGFMTLLLAFVLIGLSRAIWPSKISSSLTE
jgi:MFS family permease